MTYHPTVRERFVHLLILVICVGLVATCVFFFVTRSGAIAKQFGQAVLVTSFLLAGAIYLNWLAWSAAVEIRDQGVRWSDGTNKAELAWEEIAGFGWKTERKYLKVGLVVKSTKELRLLPFLSPALYAALKGRCGHLPAEIEKSMGFQK